MNYHVSDNTMPKFFAKMAKENAPKKYQKFMDDMHEPRFLFLVFSWTTIIVNVLLAFPALKNAIMMEYSLQEHYAVIIALCGGFAAIAAVYKYIINTERIVVSASKEKVVIPTQEEKPNV